MRARRFSDCMHVRSTAVSEIRTLDMHARARFQRSNSVMHVFTVMHDQLCMMRALFNTSFTRILLALLLDLATAAPLWFRATLVVFSVPFMCTTRASTLALWADTTSF